jgi:REP element-mobilizing transposase RayT
LIEKIKIASSIWIKEEFRERGFSWQGGYAAFSLGQSQLNRILKYIENQNEHHRKKEYKEEVIQFLKLYGMEYDERYLWD